MPPRRSAREAAVAETATSVLSPLPLSVVLHIFSLLPVDCRLRCAEVCRGWRSVLLERSLWTRLDLSRTSGVRVQRYRPTLWDGLLRGAAARAGGGLQSLLVDFNVVTHAALLQVVAANAGALRELQAHGESDPHALGFSLPQAVAVVNAAPLLRTFAADLYHDGEQAAVHRALLNEAPFGALRVRRLCVNLSHENEADVVALAADVAAHASLEELALFEAPLETAAALDAVVDAALAHRLRRVSLEECGCRQRQRPPSRVCSAAAR
jgi:hypothetical protein